MIDSGANLVTGDYSQGAVGFWIEKGELTYPVEEITVQPPTIQVQPRLPMLICKPLCP